MDSLIHKFSFINNFNNYPDAVIVIDFANNILSWNKKACEIFGYKKEEMIGRNIAILFDEESKKINESVETGKSFVISSKSKENDNIFVDISCSQLLKKQKIIITARDVTRNQKVIGKLLVEYEKNTKIGLYKNSFITGLSNDFKTPVHSLIGFSQGLLDGICGELNEKQQKYVTIMNKNANSLLDLLNDFLDLSRLEGNSPEVNMKLFTLANSVNQLAKRIRTKADAKGLQFDIDLNSLEKKNVYSDEDLLLKVLNIVLENAVKFTEIGSILLKVTHPEPDLLKNQGIEIPEGFNEKSFVLFSVKDTGIGIPDEEKSAIFDEYKQTDRNTAKKYGGTGLKLALTGKIISNLGGKIWVESDLGQGSTFSFVIPLERPKAKSIAENLEEVYAE